MYFIAFMLASCIAVYAHAADESKHLIEIISCTDLHEILVVNAAGEHLEEYLGVELKKGYSPEKKEAMINEMTGYVQDLVKIKSTLFDEGVTLDQEASLAAVLEIFNGEIAKKVEKQDIAGYFCISSDPERSLVSRVTKSHPNNLPVLIGHVPFDNGQGTVNMPGGSIVSVKKR